MRVVLSRGPVTDGEMGRECERVQLGLVVKGQQPHRAKGVRLCAAHCLLRLAKSSAQAVAVLGDPLNGHLTGHTERGEHGVAARDVEIPRNVVGRERISRAAPCAGRGCPHGTRCEI